MKLFINIQLLIVVISTHFSLGSVLEDKETIVYNLSKITKYKEILNEPLNSVLEPFLERDFSVFFSNKLSFSNDSVRFSAGITVKYLITSEIIKEWNIWRKCFGKVILLNGVSSSGKTTLTDQLTNFGFNKVSLDHIARRIFISQFRALIEENIVEAEMAGIQNRDIKNILAPVISSHNPGLNKYNSHQRKILDRLKVAADLVKEKIKPISRHDVFVDIFNQSAPYIFSGENVIIDAVLLSDKDIQYLFFSFRYYPILLVSLYSPLEENLQKCFKRNYSSIKHNISNFRLPSWIIDQYCNHLYSLSSKETFGHGNKILDRISKSKVDLMLNLVEEHTKLILLHHQLNEETKEFKIKLGDARRAIDKLRKIFLLTNNDIIYIIPRLKHDYVIRSILHAPKQVELILENILFQHHFFFP